MKLLLLSCIVSIVSYGAAEEAFEPFNVRVGTQTFAPKYSFSTTETELVETARCIHEMGSDIIKFRLSEQPRPKDTKFRSLAEVAEREPSCRRVLDMPFRHYQLWVYPVRPKLAEHTWRDGLTDEEADLEYRQVYDLAAYLLRTYAGSKKTFMFGHWEGDWSLLGHTDASKDPPEVAIRGMIDWYQVRQRAVDDARRDHPHPKVSVLHYAEVNLVVKALEDKATVTNSVLPHCTLDLVSYSCYDGLREPFPATMLSCLDLVESKAKLEGPFSRNIFIGEYGFPLLRGTRTREQQGEQTREIIKAAAGWGCPFLLYWEMYDNEAGDESKGFWLIDKSESQTTCVLRAPAIPRTRTRLKTYTACGWVATPTRRRFPTSRSTSTPSKLIRDCSRSSNRQRV